MMAHFSVNLPDELQELENGGVEDNNLEGHDFISMKVSLFRIAASMIRGHIDVRPLPEEHVLAWLDAMAAHCEDGDMAHIMRKVKSMSIRKSAYRIEPFIIVVKLCGLLRADQNLEAVVKEVAKFLGYNEERLSEQASFPSKSSISRMRFVLDASYTKLRGMQFQRMLDGEEGFKVFFLSDAPNRGGREWLFAEIYWMRSEEVTTFVNAQRSILAERTKDSPDEVAIRNYCQAMAGAMTHFVLTPAGFGARYTSAAHKFAVTMHQFRLMFESWDYTARFVENIASITTDFGAEAKLA